MENGCVHIYCGDGKGKTTAAVGLVVRCAGGGGKVIYTSFLKDNTSGELNILRGIKNIELIENPSSMKFFGRMNSEEKAELAGLYSKRMEYIRSVLENGCDMAVFDEAMAALNYGLIREETLLNIIDSFRNNTEIVLTGRNPSEKLIEKSDYVSEIKKIKHPYDRGVFARKYIEM